MPSLLTNLKHLSNANGVSGDESAVRSIVIDLIKDHVDDLRVDTLGNVLAVKRAPGSAAHRARRVRRVRVMLDAHMDEIGFMIFGANSDGSLKFRSVGGVDVRILPGKAVLVGPDRIPGAIGVKPIHLLDDDLSVLKIEDLAIDIGAASESEANSAVTVGQTATFATEFRAWNGAASGKALDNRAGCAVLIEILRGPRLPVDLLAAFTVQEEVGLRGARVAAYALDPQVAFALDSTPANDLPLWDSDEGRIENARYNTRLGAGPAIYLADASTLSDPRLARHLILTAQALDLPYQLRQPGGGGTDAGAIHKQRLGIPSISVSVPGRYMHTAAGIARLEDWKNTLALVYHALTRLSPDIFAIDR